ncbi:MAG: transposase [Methylotenera sp.]
MPRRSRIKLAGVPQYIVQRGVNREPCFFADEDYHSYLHWLKKAAWEGRYKSSVIQAETYLLACMRYIELNPVRANMVNHPTEYKWSSYAANAQGEANMLIKPHLLYNTLGDNAAKRQSAYRELFRYELDIGLVDEIRKATNSNYALGSEMFAKQIADTLGRRVTPGKSGRPKMNKSENGKNLSL